MYRVEIQSIIGGWHQNGKPHSFLDSAEKHAKELVQVGHDPLKVRIVQVIGSFEPQMKLYLKQEVKQNDTDS